MNELEVIKTKSLNGGILEVSLNRPQQLNALNKALLDALKNIFKEVKEDNNIKAILLTGEGKGFCAGADIKQLVNLNGSSGFRFAQYGQSVLNDLENLGKPSLAAIQGYAFGGGCELAMAATTRIATETAQFAQPEIKLGVIPGFGGTQRLSRLVGKGRALELCLSGRRIAAQEAHLWGLINEITTPDNLRTRGIEILTDIVKQSSNAMLGIINAMNAGYNLSLQEALELEATYFGLCCATKDKQEGVNAFIEKREAQFCGE